MKVRKLVLSALGWCYKLVVAILALFAAAYVQDHAPEWELPLAGIGVLLAAIGGLAWQRTPTRMRWLPIGVVWIGVFAAIYFAIFHGWIGVVQAIIVIIGVVFLIVSTIAFRAVFRLPPELALEASQPITPSVSDDSDAVKIYNNSAGGVVE